MFSTEKFKDHLLSLVGCAAIFFSTGFSDPPRKTRFQLFHDDFNSDSLNGWHTSQGIIPYPGPSGSLNSLQAPAGYFKVEPPFPDPKDGTITFVPPDSLLGHGFYFIAYRDDFVFQEYPAGKAMVEIEQPLFNPVELDSIGGLFLLVKFRDRDKRSRYARHTVNIIDTGRIYLDTATLMHLDSTKWEWTCPPMNKGNRNDAVSNIIGLGFLFLYYPKSGSTVQSLKIGGIRATGQFYLDTLPVETNKKQLSPGDTVTFKPWFIPGHPNTEFHWERYVGDIITPMDTTTVPFYTYIPSKSDVGVQIFRVSLFHGDSLCIRSGFFELDVPYPLEILEEPKDLNLNSGDEGKLAVRAKGHEPLKYKWIFNNKEIKNTDEPFLNIYDAKTSDSGYYMCTVSDSNGNTLPSKPARITVFPRLAAKGQEGHSLFKKITTIFPNSSIGLKAGVNFSDFYLDKPGVNTQFDFNFYELGVFAGLYHKNEYLAVQPELYFSERGSQQYVIEDYKKNVRLFYLVMPILVKAIANRTGPLPRVLAGANVFGGPYVALRLTGKEKIEFDSYISPSRDYKRTDFGLTAGAGYDGDIWLFDFRFSIGLANLNKGNSFIRKNRVISTMGGLRLRYRL